MQEAVVIIVVSGCLLWVTYMGYRYFRPRGKASGCAGGCCDMGGDAPPPTSGHTQMISSDDLRARLKARKV